MGISYYRIIFYSRKRTGQYANMQLCLEKNCNIQLRRKLKKVLRVFRSTKLLNNSSDSNAPQSRTNAFA